MNATEYSQKIIVEINKAYELANRARKKGYDPEDTVDIPLAKDMAERVEGLVSVSAPQVRGAGIPLRIKELEAKYGKSDWRVALTVSLETAQEKFCKFESKKLSMETGIRIGIAYLTMGIVASPIEGFVELKIKKTQDGKEYMALMYSGPIRSAGGTAGAVSLIIADHIRKNMGYAPYDATEKEARRMVTELYDYHERVTNLQYLPSEKEIMFLTQHLPVQIDGDPSEKIEVSNYKDIDRIETNRIRSGACLVMGECIAQKAPKVYSQLKKWASDFGLEHWSFLEEFVNLQKEIKAKKKVSSKGIVPIFTYIQDLVAGRPVLTHPLAHGGFRLRYGRTRTSGYSSTSIHPASMHALDKYIAIGTQLKMERPGKATALTSCDSIEGPIVKLKNGSVVFLETEEIAKQALSEVSEILFLGDILISFGDFYNRAHTLAPAGYCEEWWALEAEKAMNEKFGSLDFKKLSEFTGIGEDECKSYIKDYFYNKPDAKKSITLSEKLNIPLHSKHTYHWKLISKLQLLEIINWLKEAKIEITESYTKIILPKNDSPKRSLELIGMPHLCVNNEFVVIEDDAASVIFKIFNLSDPDFTNKYQNPESEDVLEIINQNSEIKQRDKSGIFIGTRMGRPEKAKVRKMDGDPHTLFPVGKEGGKMRSFQSSLEKGTIEAEFPIFFCPTCKKETIFGNCETCQGKAVKMYYCNTCGIMAGPKCVHGPAQKYRKSRIDINHYFKNVIKRIGMEQYPDLIKGVKGTSNKNHVPEHFAKGILRAKHEVPVNKDGTTRYDMTQLPITHFNSAEIGTPVKRLIELGYTHDIYGNNLVSETQILELVPQDIILPNCEDAPEPGADKILFSTANFIDELLVSFYGQEKYYNLESYHDLVGHLVLMLAPHTSAGIVARIIGFSRTQGLFAHPLLHAATRRDCDGDEASVTLLMDALLNFSRNFLPNSRGSTQDAPLVLTSLMNASEVDDMAFDLDVVDRYPLEFYDATYNYEQPSNVKIERFGKRIEEGISNGILFTHPVSSINAGIKCSSYKTIPSMEDKLKGQMELADKIRAVDAADVARLVIEKHLLRDIKGNLRKFSTQQFRCSKCSDKYRRPPLSGKCLQCGSRIIFTVTEGAIVKYLEPAMSLSDKYNLPAYLKQVLELTKDRVEGVFGRDLEKQEGLNRWFG